MWSSEKVFKDIKIFWTVHSRPFIRYQGKNLDCLWIWCCFRFFLLCLVQPNQDIHFLLHIIFIKRIRLWIIHTVNLYFTLLKYCSLKLVSANFYQIFIFHQTIAPQKLWKMFFISSKKLFSFSKFSNFCIFVFPSFFPCQPLF